MNCKFLYIKQRIIALQNTAYCTPRKTEKGSPPKQGAINGDFKPFFLLLCRLLGAQLESRKVLASQLTEIGNQAVTGFVWQSCSTIAKAIAMSWARAESSPMLTQPFSSTADALA